jgi:hypothetical protein
VSGGWLIDRHMPEFDVSERHAVAVAAPAAIAYEAVRRVDLAKSRPIRALFAVRGLPLRLRARRNRPGSLGVDDLLRAGFVLLDEEPGVEIVLGAAGRFWTPSGGLRRMDASEFGEPAVPGEARAVWSFRVGPRRDGGSWVVTETRVRCPDERTRRRFILYWGVIGPFSGWIRRSALRLIKSDAESRSQPPGTIG